jgi:hypothetical protein
MNKKEEVAYLAKWYPRIERIRALGFEVRAFDPGMSVYPVDRENGYMLPADIPPWMLTILECLAVKLFPETADDKAMVKRRKQRLSKKPTTREKTKTVNACRAGLGILK